MSGREHDEPVPEQAVRDETVRDLEDSDQDVEGGMGLSSERTGPGAEGATGVRDTRELPDDGSDADTPPEQSTGNPEPQPEGLPPKAGYSSKDPRADDET